MLEREQRLIIFWMKNGFTRARSRVLSHKLRVGSSGRLELVARNLPPRPGQTYWLIEVEFRNTTAADIELKGAGLDLRTKGGGAVAFSISLGPAFVPYSGASWTLPGKKKQPQTFLAEVDEGVDSLVFTYQGAAPLTISPR